MIISQVFLVLLGIIILIERSGYRLYYLYLTGFLTLLVLIFFILKKILSSSKNRIRPIRNKYLKLASKYFKRFMESLQRIWIEVQSKPLKIIHAFFWTTVHWLLGAFEIYFILTVLLIPILPVDALIMDMGVVGIKSLAGFIPGQFGVEELSNKLLLELIGINVVGIWLTVSIVRRAKQLFWIAASFLSYFAINLKTGNYGGTVYNT